MIKDYLFEFNEKRGAQSKLKVTELARYGLSRIEKFARIDVGGDKDQV